MNRNDPCPCGSGKKYKHCCEGKAASRGRYRSLGIALATIIVVVGGIWLLKVNFPSDSAPVQPGLAPATQGQAGTPQPPGPAPAGKVWSAEHGHWHDAPGGLPPGTGAGVPQPPGPAPAGKVWSPEHGHWHDAATGVADPNNP